MTVNLEHRLTKAAIQDLEQRPCRAQRSRRWDEFLNFVETQPEIPDYYILNTCRILLSSIRVRILPRVWISANASKRHSYTLL